MEGGGGHAHTTATSGACAPRQNRGERHRHADGNGSAVVSDEATLEVMPVSIAIIGQGTLDSAKQAGPRWVRIDFDSLATALHTVTVSWDSDADVRFTVNEMDGSSIGPTIRGSNPGTWQGELDANEQYYIGLWSTDGIASYIATVEAPVDLSITAQPVDLTLAEGEEATFRVSASGSGTLGYQWFADGTALAGDPSLGVRLSPGTVDGTLVFELTNEGDEPLAVLREGTPLEPTLSADVFEVTHVTKERPGLERVPYAGRLVKRVATRAEDFVALEPGESLSARVELTSHYAVVEGGDYRIAFRGRILSLPVRPLRARAKVEPLVTTPAAETLRMRLAPSPELLARARPPTFNGCDARQQQQLVEATSAAETITGEALRSLLELSVAERPGSPRYTAWFGAHDATRYALVADNFARILDSLADATLNYDCTCDEPGVYAFVRPINLHDVFLCPTFFAVSVLGTDSRAGTLVHELSHFTALAGTDDHAYGQDAAAVLAGTDPTLAVDNADSYEYFAENEPALPMAGDGGPSETDPPLDPDLPIAPDDEPSSPDFLALELAVPREGRLAEEAVARYTARGADLVSLESSGGDADLYVYDDPGLEDEALICSSEEDGTEIPLDSCPLPDRATTYYAVVYGFSATDYRIVAERVDLPPAPTPEITRIEPGASVENRLAEGETDLFVARSPLRAELTSLDGDADLFVFSDDSFADEALLCRSRLVSSVDVCDLAGGGAVYLVVSGYSTAAYRLEIDAVPDPDPPQSPDSPTTPPTPTDPPEDLDSPTTPPTPTDPPEAPDSPTTPPTPTDPPRSPNSPESPDFPRPDPSPVPDPSTGPVEDDPDAPTPVAADDGGGSVGWCWLLVGGTLLAIRRRGEDRGIGAKRR